MSKFGLIPLGKLNRSGCGGYCRKQKAKFCFRSMLIVAVLAGLTVSPLHAEQNSISEKDLEIVNAFNYVEAKTAIQFDKYLALARGELNKLSHRRTLVGVDARSSKRLNRDTLYSVAIVDISAGATLVLPSSDDRYISAQVVNQQGYTNKVFYGAGNYHLGLDEFDTPFVWVLIRTLVSEQIDGDIELAHALQDKMLITSKSKQPYSHPNYDQISFEKTTELLIELAAGLSSNSGAAGKKEDVDPLMQLLTAAYGFGTLPESESLLVTVQPNLPADGAYTLTVKDVPVDGFWSLAVYNKDGYFEKNRHDSYGVNDRSARPNADGSVTIHFGGDPSNKNYIPIVDGWNYVVRLYKPRAEVLNGTWQFPRLNKDVNKP